MKIITQISLFDDTQNENLGDLERLQKVFDNIPDDKLIRKLKEKRGREEMNGLSRLCGIHLSPVLYLTMIRLQVC